MNKRGFTLVELLAVIVILGILLVIAIPKISDIISVSKEGTFKTDINSIIKLVKIHYQENYGGSLNSSNKIYNIENNKIMLNNVDLKLSSKTGTLTGTVEVNSNGETKVIIHNSDYCGLKNFDSELSVHSLSVNNSCSL